MCPPFISPCISHPPPHFFCGLQIQLTYLSSLWQPEYRKSSFGPALSLLCLKFSLNDFVCLLHFILFTSCNNSWKVPSWLLPLVPFKNMMERWGALWLSWLSVWFWLRSWSHSLWIWTPHWPLCRQLRAWSLLQILHVRVCVYLSLPSPACTVSFWLSLSKVNKH